MYAFALRPGALIPMVTETIRLPSFVFQGQSPEMTVAVVATDSKRRVGLAFRNCSRTLGSSWARKKEAKVAAAK
jgi:hypothetical protein